MGRLFLDITTSIDGFVAAPGVSIDQPLGVGGRCLHDWISIGTQAAAHSEVDRRVAAEMFESAGAFLIGRTTFDVGEDHWGEEGAFGMPCFVVTHRPRPPLIRGSTTFYFVTEGIHAALDAAKDAAGRKDVCLMGGADLIAQYVEAGLLDELHVHIAPLLLGSGTRLFERQGSEPIRLERTRTLESSYATHLSYRIHNPLR